MLSPIVKPSSPHPNSEPLKAPNREGWMLRHPDLLGLLSVSCPSPPLLGFFCG